MYITQNKIYAIAKKHKIYAYIPWHYFFLYIPIKMYTSKPCQIPPRRCGQSVNDLGVALILVLQRLMMGVRSTTSNNTVAAESPASPQTARSDSKLDWMPSKSPAKNRPRCRRWVCWSYTAANVEYKFWRIRRTQRHWQNKLQAQSKISFFNVATSTGTPYWINFLQRAVCVNWMKHTYVETNCALMAAPACVQNKQIRCYFSYIFS